jgi:hypothetical protein
MCPVSVIDFTVSEICLRFPEYVYGFRNMFTVSEIYLMHTGIVVPREYITTPSGVLLDPWSLTVEGGQPGARMKGHVDWLSVHCEDAKSEMSVRIRIESESDDSRPFPNCVPLCVTIFQAVLSKPRSPTIMSPRIPQGE